MKKSILLSCLLGVLALYSCNKETTKPEAGEEKLTPEQSAMLKAEIDTLISDMEYYQKLAFASENEKISSGEKLITEIELTVPNYDRAMLDSLRIYYKGMKDAVYTQTTFHDETVMLKYDDQNKLFVDAMRKMVGATPMFSNYQRANILYQDILTTDGNDFQIRKEYNNTVYMFNALLKSKAETIKAFGGKYAELSPARSFYGDVPVQ